MKALYGNRNKCECKQIRMIWITKIAVHTTYIPVPLLYKCCAKLKYKESHLKVSSNYASSSLQKVYSMLLLLSPSPLIFARVFRLLLRTFDFLLHGQNVYVEKNFDCSLASMN